MYMQLRQCYTGAQRGMNMADKCPSLAATGRAAPLGAAIRCRSAAMRRAGPAGDLLSHVLVSARERGWPSQTRETRCGMQQWHAKAGAALHGLG